MNLAAFLSSAGVLCAVMEAKIDVDVRYLQTVDWQLIKPHCFVE